jgi:hypothetical protein
MARQPARKNDTPVSVANGRSSSARVFIVDGTDGFRPNEKLMPSG